MEAVVAREYEDRLLEFLNTYYSEQIKNLLIVYPQKRSLYVDIVDLERFDHELAQELLNNPDPVIIAANEALAKLNPAPNPAKPLYVRFFNSDPSAAPLLQDVGSDEIGKLLTIDSLITKRSEIMPKVHVGVFRCNVCGAVVKLDIEHEEVPEVCPQCKHRSLKQVTEESQFIDLQKLEIQDPLEKLKGNVPNLHMEIWLQDDLVNSVLPGDRADITGILRIRPRITSRGKQEKSVFTMFLDAVSVKPKQKEFAELEITPEEEAKIIELAKDPLIFDKLAKSIAPSIYGYDEIKKAIVLQLFGGTPDKRLVDGGLIRSDIHILLIGDPGTAKTRLLQAVSSIVPKGIYVSGKSVSSAGLTATAERDELSEGGWTLKAGALVLGSGGTVCIDEFDKISDEDKAGLLEAMESQTISVAKAGIVARFNAKTSILASANPKFGRFEKNIYPSEQFDIPPALLSRFDLIFPIADLMDEELDRNIAKHILVQHEAAGAQLEQVEAYEQVAAPPIDPELLRKYIAYARKNIKPRLLREASDRIANYYIELRKLGLKQGVTPITPRQIEGLVRLAEASAKARLSPVVTSRDADVAISLFEYMLNTLAVDRSGRRDIDILQTGMPKEKVDKINALMNIIKELEEKEKTAKVTAVLEEAEKIGIDRQTAIKYLDELERSGDVYMPKPGELKIVKHEAE
ncbi:MAG: minichromosome maintenance protein MCM [Candidatus Micrarchaeia archaeon]|jgi:replicative DNA helicase Mcm